MSYFRNAVSYFCNIVSYFCSVVSYLRNAVKGCGRSKYARIISHRGAEFKGVWGALFFTLFICVRIFVHNLFTGKHILNIFSCVDSFFCIIFAQNTKNTNQQLKHLKPNSNLWNRNDTVISTTSTAST